mgnify:CR=1 FL=1
MKKKLRGKIQKLWEAGKFKKVQKELSQPLKDGDLEARYLRAHFSLGEISEEEQSANLIAELKDLSRLGYLDAVRELAWCFRHGDDVQKDEEIFALLIGFAASEGHEKSKEDLDNQVEMLVDSDFSSRVK